jgi:hypothetical protein
MLGTYGERPGDQVRYAFSFISKTVEVLFMPLVLYSSRRRFMVAGGSLFAEHRRNQYMSATMRDRSAGPRPPHHGTVQRQPKSADDIEGWKIVRVQSAKLGNAYREQRYELDRKTIIPGLVGMHEHLFTLYRYIATACRCSEMADSAPQLHLASVPRWFGPEPTPPPIFEECRANPGQS